MKITMIQDVRLRRELSRTMQNTGYRIQEKHVMNHASCMLVINNHLENPL